VETALEYLAVGVLLVAILIAANQMLSAPAATLDTVRQEQLYTVAERVLDKIVLTPGYPEDWGTNIAVSADNLQDFGLALAGSREPYRVDPDKVMRLANLSTLPNPLLLNASRLAQLLGLEGYGYRLRIVPMLKITITPVGYYTYGNYVFASTFRIRVENAQGLGVPNADVTGMYALVRAQPGVGEATVEAKNVIAASALTDALGECVLDFTPSLQQYFSDPRNKPDKWFFAFLIVRAEWRGFVSVAGYATNARGDAPVEGYIIGNYVFVNRTISPTPVKKGNKQSGAVLVKDELLQAVPEYQELLNFTTVVWCRDSTGNFRNDDPLCNNAGKVLPSAKQWYLIGYIRYVEPLASHVFIFAQFRGNPIAIVVNRIPSIDVSNGRGAAPANAVRLTRMCTVYNYPFLVELTVWRWVEGFP